MRTTILAAALLALPGAARAATMGTIPVDYAEDVTGEADAPGPQKWTLNLEAGRYYGIRSLSDAVGNVSVHAAGGRTLVSYLARGEDGWHGAGFRAPYTGAYTVQVACQTFSTGVACPGWYALSAGRDRCSGDRSTRCAIAVGRTVGGGLSYVEDSDWWRARLAAGVTYRITMTVPPADDFGTCVAIRGSGGRSLASGCENSPSGAALTFTAPASGVYYLEAAGAGEEPPGSYALRLSR